MHPDIKAALGRSLAGAGAVAWGVSPAGPLPAPDHARFTAWLARGAHAGMHYMQRNAEARRDPRLVLPSARSIISVAFPCHPPVAGCPVAAYALGADYHRVLRERLQPVCALLTGPWRICVDSAPVAERSRAVASGVGFIGRNGMLIVPGAGSYVVLAEILTAMDLEPDTPSTASCGNCGHCLAACPTGALGPDGVDARRCISYLTTEHRGPLPPGASLHGRLCGCDACQMCCPHNSTPAAPLPELAPRPEVLALTAASAAVITSGDYRRLTRGSALSRLSLSQLRRNALAAPTPGIPHSISSPNPDRPRKEGSNGY